MILQPVTGGTALTAALRLGVQLVGVKDGANTVFTTPDKFVHVPGQQTATIVWNGRRLTLGKDYSVAESGGFGSGYDQITLLWTSLLPRVEDDLQADYLAVI